MELQTEMLHLDLIDAEGGIQEEEEEEENERPPDPVDAVDDNHKEEQGAGLPVIQPKLKDFIHPVAMDTYRPKRPTTLNLFPQVPRTQVRQAISNSVCGSAHRQGLEISLIVQCGNLHTAQTGIYLVGVRPTRHGNISKGCIFSIVL